jgi:hypothetical protein
MYPSPYSYGCDSMYAAIREFYFRGTLYPPSVGIEDSPQAKAVAAVAVADKECDEQRPDGEVSDQDVGVGTYAKDEDDTCERANYFPGYHFSAYIVTNESPNIWFKPLKVLELSLVLTYLSAEHTRWEQR